MLEHVRSRGLNNPLCLFNVRYCSRTELNSTVSLYEKEKREREREGERERWKDRKRKKDRKVEE